MSSLSQTDPVRPVHPGWLAPASTFRVRVVRALSVASIADLGYWATVALAFSLPFEITQRPLLDTSPLTLTNLKLLFYAVAALAALTLLRDGLWSALSSRRVAALLYLGFLAATLASAAASTHRQTGLKWTIDFALYGLVWLALPRWLSDCPERRRRTLALALILGAAVAAVIGLAEVALTPRLNAPLSIFKVQPSLIGPYLRLSATFQYANTAAGYLAAVLPLAVVWLIAVWRGGRLQHVIASLGVAVTVAALLLTYSRGAAIAAGSGLLVLWLARRCPRPRAISPARSALFLAAALGPMALWLALAASGPGLLRLTTQSDLEWYNASFQARTLPASVPPNSLLRVPVTVHNTGALTWRNTGSTPFHLSYHWLDAAGQIVVFDGLRTSFQHPVRPGASSRVIATVATPDRPGSYRLVWDIAEEGVTWFAVLTGTYAGVPVTVAPGPLSVTQGPPSSARPRGYPPPPTASSALPAAPSQPERSVLWAAALRMIAAHPILGVGPDGFRLNYGRYSRPTQQSWDQRIFANSLPLELAADLGIIGAGLFFGFLLASVWPLAGRLLGGSALGTWQAALLAVLAVILVHGFSDYLLGSHAVAILLFLVLGALGFGPRPKAQSPRPA